MSDQASMRRVVLGIVGAACVLGGCASHSVRPEAVAPVVDALAVAATVETENARLARVGASIVPGISVAPSREDWQIGDRVLIGIRAAKPEGVTTRLLLVELLDHLAPGKGFEIDSATSGGSGKTTRAFKFISPSAATRLTVYDENGAKIDEAMGRFPVKLLGYGPLDGSMLLADNHELAASRDESKVDAAMESLDEAQYDKMMRGWLTLFAFSGSMNKKGMFKGMLEDVIVKPSWLRILFHPSMSLGFGKDQWPTREANWTPGGAGGGASLTTLRIPLALEIAGKPALDGEMLAAEPAAPLSLAGGLIRANGHRPDDPEVRVDIWLMGAARGTGGREFKAAEGK